MCLKCGVFLLLFFVLFFYLLSCPVILQVSYLDLHLVVELVYLHTFLKVIFFFIYSFVISLSGRTLQL